MTRIHLSGVVVCQDNESTVGAVIDSLAPVCDEVVVVDGGSRDATVDVAKARDNVRLYERDFDNHAAQKNFACDQARGSWILILDSDELIGGRGVERLRWLTHVPGMRWYSLPRYWLVERDGELHYIAERPWYRDRQLRLFRNEPGFRYDEKQHPVHHEVHAKRGWGRPLRQPHIFHYALLLQGREEREHKFRRYMQLEPDSERLHRMQLWEDADARLEPLPDPLPGMLR
jgi:glycosyltransferase involved in cell wall biosynthesis